MSEEQLNAFFEKVKADTSLQEKLKTAASPEAAIEIAKAAGFSITPADIQSMDVMQSTTVELSDEELEDVGGGLAADGNLNSVSNYNQSIPMSPGGYSSGGYSSWGIE